MRKNKENNFAHKFRLLNSQECSDDIYWSMSSSSEEENYTNVNFCNLTNRRRYNKRKRRKKANNVSNLDITVIDTTSACTEVKSPILCDKTSIQVSPVLGSKLVQHSPILVPRSSQKSPILHRNSVKVIRKLFKNNNTDSNSTANIGPQETMCESFMKEKNLKPCDNLIVDHQNISKTITSNTFDKSIEKNSKHDIYRNVKCFFDSNFTSDNASQNSISDATTLKDSLLSDEVDISSGTPDHEATSPKAVNKSTNEKFHKDVVKKMKYKKDGLAYRLNGLLKKQYASYSLWRHEKYLADNSNFVIPKEEHLPFRVKSVKGEYGCTILKAVDENDLSYCIVINNIFLSENIECDSIVKIYKPYTMIHCDSYTIVLNVCKYDNLVMKIGEKY